MRRFLGLAVLLFLAVFVSTAQAGTIVFQDNFNAENGGVGALNYAAFAHWTISDGTVDLIGNGFFSFSPVTDGHGLYVDLDGSTANAGLMLSIPLTLSPGHYSLFFQLAGNQRQAGDEVVDFYLKDGGTTFDSGAILVTEAQAFTGFIVPFTVTSPMQFSMTFSNHGGDNIGALLDNVELTQTPEPGAIVMIATGLGALAGIRRRR